MELRQSRNDCCRLWEVKDFCLILILRRKVREGLRTLMAWPWSCAVGCCIKTHSALVYLNSHSCWFGTLSWKTTGKLNLQNCGYSKDIPVPCPQLVQTLAELLRESCDSGICDHQFMSPSFHSHDVTSPCCQVLGLLNCITYPKPNPSSYTEPYCEFWNLNFFRLIDHSKIWASNLSLSVIYI